MRRYPKILLGAPLFRRKDLSTDDLFMIAKQAGYDGIDYTPSLSHLYKTPQNILAKSKQYNIPIVGVHVPLALVGTIPWFLFKRVLKLPTLFPDCEVYNLHLSGFLLPLIKRHALKRFVKNALDEKVNITFESNPIMPPLNIHPKATYDPDTFATFCIINKLPITFDTSHIATANYDILTFYKKYYKHIALIHLSDYKDGVQHLPLGHGALPLKQFFQALKRTGYKKHIVYELVSFPKTATKEEKLRYVSDSLDFAKENL